MTARANHRDRDVNEVQSEAILLKTITADVATCEDGIRFGMNVPHLVSVKAGQQEASIQESSEP
jgi:hypothetical protein